MPVPDPDRGAPPVLSDGVVVLRAPRQDDVDEITSACQDSTTIAWTTVPVPYERTDAVAWVERALEDWWSGPVFAISTVDGAWAGSIDLRLRQPGAAEVGYLIAPAMRGRWLATRALRLVCAWGFATFGLEVITWMAGVGNDPSRAVAERVGFRIHRDVARKAMAQRGARVDAWVGDLLPGDLIDASARRTAALNPALTPRERQILQSMSLGRSNRQIASSLGISENTVKNHVRSILDKLHASSRVEAVMRGIQAGITPTP